MLSPQLDAAFERALIALERVQLVKEHPWLECFHPEPARDALDAVYEVLSLVAAETDACSTEGRRASGASSRPAARKPSPRRRGAP